MIDNKWFCEPDELRESWCFLILYQKDQKDDFVISGWEIEYGNSSRIIRKIYNSKNNEEGIINELLEEIHYCRKKRITIITFGFDVIPAIRTRISILDLKEVSLRGIRNIALEKLISENFLFFNSNKSPSIEMIAKKMNIESDCFSNVELLRNIFLRIGPLLQEVI